ncbi:MULTISPECIES: DUF423 domain-containing protein [Psychrobacillus]|uniref:DUF423 domain-containing protein n=1 Tax=Psychrobacillus lasiicapitis TaxID=1636719 RepID=A0A544TC33_9BACI|nr:MULTISPECIES: DUF423 domain-containing protein [Psychrobacillus]MDI2587825.1 DUF423 domain-containing protein [Psychrobacillus sp. NEAU-3TGS]TQR15020.1 DUF423 domain-containing protein [Psychrobacillus lasiicapitis]GGA21816.1 UPF0382 membrane protein YwdK [Psychrobacillus lasiicapitis]
MKLFIIAGAINGFLAVAFGAFGAHALKEKLSEKYLAIWETAVQYQMFHALALIAIGILMSSKILGPVSSLNTAGYLILAGIILFSGSLYVLSLTGIGILGAITPIGGVAFLVGWIMIIVAAAKFAS